MKHIRYILIGSIESTMMNMRTGRVRNKPMSYSLSPISTMLTEDGDVANIRYIPNNPEILVSKQNVGDESMMYKMVKKPVFTHGMMIVPVSQKNLIKYMDNHPGNEANQSWGLPGQKAIFRKYDAEEEARKSNEANRNLSEAMRQVYLAENSKRVAVAKYLNLSHDNVAFMEQDLMGYASKNPDKFLELLADQVVMRYSEIDDAEKLGIIKIEPTRVTWADGRQIIVCPNGKDPKRYFTEATFDRGYIGAWEEVKRELSKIKRGVVEPEEVLDPTREKAQKLKQLTSDQLFEKAKDAGILEYKVPNYVFGKYKGKGAKGFSNLIDESEALKDMIVAALSN